MEKAGKDVPAEVGTWLSGETELAAAEPWASWLGTKVPNCVHCWGSLRTCTIRQERRQKLQLQGKVYMLPQRAGQCYRQEQRLRDQVAHSSSIHSVNIY
jgi:hypothetical protein